MKNPIYYVVVYLISLTAITLLWWGYEYLIYDQTYPSGFDTIIVIVLSVSLTFNKFCYDMLKENK